MKVKEEYIRSAMLLGESGIKKLTAAKVAVFGVGGVGGYVCEALARAGVGELHLFDNDVVSLSNINRQIIAPHSTVGRPKVEVMKERILDINPDCKVVTHQVFYLP
jgi:tRNA A37 threonylcarbamoyladenosine dehydratase